MWVTKIASLLIFGTVILGTAWITAERIPSPKIKIDSFETTVSDFGIVITNLHRPGVFFSILGYDEAVITKEGEQVRLGTFAEKPQIKNVLSKVTNLLMNRVLTFESSSENGKTRVFYSIYPTSAKTWEIAREITSQSEVAAVETGFIFNTDDEIYLDSKKATKPANSDILTETAVETVTIKNSRLPQSLSIDVAPGSTLSIDFAFHIIKEHRTLVSPDKRTKVTQIIEIKDL